MAKSIAVDRVATKIGENYTHIKYTYVYTNGNSTVDRKTVVKRDDLKGYRPLGKPKCKTIVFPDGTGKLWSWEQMYEKI